MTIPRLTIRSLLGVVAVAAVISMFGGPAFGGRAWAVGVTVAVGSFGAMLIVGAGFFVLCMAAARLLGADQVVARTSRGGFETGARSGHDADPSEAAT